MNISQPDNIDTTKKSSWWFLTAFNEDITFLEQLIRGEIDYPPSWKAVYGGREEGLKTQCLHFQAALNTAQVRWSEIKKVLKQTRIEACKKGSDKLVAYVMKAETAVGEKTISSNPKFITLEGLMILIATEYLNHHGPAFASDLTKFYKNKNCGYEELSCMVVSKKLYLSKLCSQPQSIRCWRLYHDLYIQHCLKNNLYTHV